MFPFSLMSAAAPATAAITAASLGIGTADALGAVLLFLINIEAGAAKDRNDDRNNQKINHILFLSGKFCLQLVIRIDAQEHNNANHNDHCGQAAKKACAHTAGGDQGADLVD